MVKEYHPNLHMFYLDKKFLCNDKLFCRIHICTHFKLVKTGNQHTDQHASLYAPTCSVQTLKQFSIKTLLFRIVQKI